MIDYNLLISLTETVGMPTKNKGSLFSVFNAEKSGSNNQLIVKDLMFFYDNKKEYIAKSLLNSLPKYIKEDRNKTTNLILKSALDYYNLKLFSVLMSSHSCTDNSLSKDAKEYIKNIWNELKPKDISPTWWNNDFIKLLSTKKSPKGVRETILKQIKQAPKLLNVPKINQEPKPKKPKTLYMNIESTGIEMDDEVIQVSIVTKNGKILFNEMVKPSKLMTERASELNGITDNMLSEFAGITEYYEKIKNILSGNITYAYRIDFDERLLKQSFEKYGLNTDFFRNLDTRDTREYKNVAHIAGETQREQCRQSYAT